MKIAVLLTTFNRREKTVTCLRQVRGQQLAEGIALSVYLTDDGSKDGTAEAAAACFSGIHIFHGDGSLFWAGGMRKSWNEAKKDDPDFYFLLNDDTVLQDNTISRLLDTYKEASASLSKPVIAIGSTQNDEGKISYGGWKLTNSKKITNTVLIENNETFAECDLGNANIMLVPRAIVKSIGILSDKYTHGIADYDYTLTAKKNGFPVVVAPGILGFCVDDHGNNWKSANTTLKERINYLYSPKGLAYKEYMQFIKTHFPSHYPEAFSKMWLKTLFPFLWDKLKKESVH